MNNETNLIVFVNNTHELALYEKFFSAFEHVFILASEYVYWPVVKKYKHSKGSISVYGFDNNIDMVTTIFTGYKSNAFYVIREHVDVEIISKIKQRGNKLDKYLCLYGNKVSGFTKQSKEINGKELFECIKSTSTNRQSRAKKSKR